MSGSSPTPKVFVSYSRRDSLRASDVCKSLRLLGIEPWLDTAELYGGAAFDIQIVNAIRGCDLFLVLCSDASMRSRHVRQEILLAWRDARPILPLLIERCSIPDQLAYWLEGWQLVECMPGDGDSWVHQVRTALGAVKSRPSDGSGPMPVQPKTLAGLRAVSRFTDQIWPIHADGVRRTSRPRGLGAPQDDIVRGQRLGSKVGLVIEADRAGHLVLLDEGPERIVYCLCPSWFAPDTRLTVGRNYFPQEHARFESFLVTGVPGREELLAVVTDQPLPFSWMTQSPNNPARILHQRDVGNLIDQLISMPPDEWIALSTYFDVVSS